jgi:hypothetical protein
VTATEEMLAVGRLVDIDEATCAADGTTNTRNKHVYTTVSRENSEHNNREDWICVGVTCRTSGSSTDSVRTTGSAWSSWPCT